MSKILLTILVGVALSTSFSWALVIDPPGVKLFGLPGETIEGSIALKNEKTELIELEVVHRNGSLTAEEFPDWLALKPQKMSLEPDEETQLYYKVEIPEEATGQFLAIIGFDEAVKGEAGQMLNIRTRISIYLAVTIEGTEVYTGEIQSINFNPMKPTQLNVVVENKGNVYVKSQGYCRITNCDGDVVAEFTVNPKKAPVYAGKNRNLIGIMDRPLEPGDYEVTVEFPFPDEAHLIKKTGPLRIIDEHESNPDKKEP